MRNAIWFELLCLPRSSVIGLLRKNIGSRTLPPWHLMVLIILFLSGYFITKQVGFLYCGLMVLTGFGLHIYCWLENPQPVHPDATGTMIDGDPAPPVWRQFGEPLMAIAGGAVALYFDQFILGGWLIFASVCMAIAANETVEVASVVWTPIQWWIGTPPALTQTRIVLALAVAALADLIQIPITMAENSGILFIPGVIADALLDCVTMAVTILLLGFHKLLLPSFLMEAVPELDAVPTWTGCVAFVVWQRKKEPATDSSPVTEIQATEVESSSVTTLQTPLALPQDGIAHGRGFHFGELSGIDGGDARRKVKRSFITRAVMLEAGAGIAAENGRHRPIRPVGCQLPDQIIAIIRHQHIAHIILGNSKRFIETRRAANAVHGSGNAAKSGDGCPSVSLGEGR